MVQKIGKTCDCLNAAMAFDLLCEIIMVRDNFLTLPGWSTCDDINDIIFSVCLMNSVLHVH